MQNRIDHILKPRRGILAGALVATLAGVAAGWLWMHDDTNPEGPASEKAVSQLKAGREGDSVPPAAMGGRRVVVDPATGRITTNPTAVQAFEGALLTDMPGAFSRSAQGLVETPVVAPAGGFKVDLQGRFMSASRISLDAEGRLKAECRSDCTLPHQHVRSTGTEPAQVTSKEQPE